MEVDGQLYALVVLPLWKELRPQSRSEHFGEEKNLLLQPEFEPQIVLSMP
jgi:hypothetical protein